MISSILTPFLMFAGGIMDGGLNERERLKERWIASRQMPRKMKKRVRKQNPSRT